MRTAGFSCRVAALKSGKVRLMAKIYPLNKPTAAAPAEPEHGTVGDVRRLFGISRAVCEQRVRDGTFQSMLFCQPGTRKGVRLIYLDSVRRYLRRQQLVVR
jgi:hypothetical protein